MVMEKSEGRLGYCYGNGLPLNETHHDKVLRMLKAQHPPEPLPSQEAQLIAERLHSLFSGKEHIV